MPRDAALTRDIQAAQAAFAQGDSDASQRAHAAPQGSGGGTEAGHACGERSVEKAFVFAGFEGIAVVATLHAAAFALQLSLGQSAGVVLGGTVALGLATTLREYERAREAFAHFFRERQREMWELKNYPEGEEQEMVELYASKGMTPADARVAIQALARYPQLFVDVMMSEELGLVKPDVEPWRVGAAAAAGFCLWGLGAALGALAALRLHPVPGVALQRAAAETASLWGAELSAVLAGGGGGGSLLRAAWWAHMAAAADPLGALALVCFAVAVTHGAAHATLLPSVMQGRGGLMWRFAGVFPGAGVLLTVSAVALAAALVGGLSL